MDKELKAKWVAALRSGSYRQGIGVLRNTKDAEPVHCCLGVVCDIVDPAGWDDDDCHVLNARSFPSRRILEACGVSSDSTEDDHPFWKLVTLNDNGASFAVIADHIEANL